jgi:predicted transposase/invertase (TIGR01784 family)
MGKLVRFDWAMKYLLRHKANFDILEGFLSELLKSPIHIEQIIESESNKNHESDKSNRVDLLAKTSGGEYIIIEVQTSRQWDYLSRILYGASKVVCEYIGEGDSYRKIRKVISVSIVFFDLGSGKDYLYRGTTTFKGIHYQDILGLNAQEKEFYCKIERKPEMPETIFPEYYLIKVMAFKERVQDKIDEWIYFFKYGKIEKDFDAQGLNSAKKKLEVLKLSEEERRAYEKYQESLHDDASLREMLEITEEKGVEKGIEKGIEQGLLKVGLSLKKAGMPDSEIAAHTGLSSEKIKTLTEGSGLKK